jgi:hypothetical protein
MYIMEEGRGGREREKEGGRLMGMGREVPGEEGGGGGS